MKKIITTLGVLIAIVLVLVLLKSEVNAPITSPSPSPTATTQPSPASEANIIIDSPKAGSTVENPITVTGRARVFEGHLSYLIRNNKGAVIYESYATIGAPEFSKHQNFTIKIPVPLVTDKNLTLEFFEYSAKDGSVVNLVKVPVKLSTLETATANIFLTRDGGNDCSVVYPYGVEFIKTKETAFITLFELLKRDPADKSLYRTQIPGEAKLNSINIRSGVAYADFDMYLDYQVAGSCRVTAIRSQITQTLKQFSTIKDVVISINGRTEDILQP